MSDASARARILAAAQDLFQRRGFHAVGLSDILAVAKAPKGSLYHHFPAGKDELGARAVEGIAADVTAYIAARRAEGAGAVDIIGDLAEMSARRMEQERFGWSPLIAAVAHQTGADTPLLAQALAGAYAGWRRLLGEAFADEGFAPEIAQSLARTAIALLEGAVILARVDRDAAPLRAVQRQTTRLAALEREDRPPTNG
ncbi:MAG: TetR/AcrR family transcriptional regulator [Hyphomonadaceae bacterium]|nr:MAG: TetR family transcriptional regulator [Caulobacteraceae bacterium]MBT9445357.1 TetR/AcrR family transcriptional regulator [Hyphomonadaceae bacterium]TPW05273.1 MAG: TetR family transcriptional regulator [Alphaproteobacteria bacterium]